MHLPNRTGLCNRQRERGVRWFPLTTATVYFDHPVHAAAAHTLNVDFINPEQGPSACVAVELDPASARSLAEAILLTLETTGAELGV